MSELVLYIASSVDGFIAREDGNVDWLHSPNLALEGEDFGYADFYGSVGATIMGNSTYKMIEGFDLLFPYPETDNYVFTRDHSATRNEHVAFISDDIINFVHQLKKASEKDVWLIGGGQINTLMLINGLLDKIILSIIPVSLGKGIPVFKGDHEAWFTLHSSKAYENGIIQMEYRTTKNS